MCQRCSPWRVGSQPAAGQVRSRTSPPGGRGLCLLLALQPCPASPIGPKAERWQSREHPGAPEPATDHSLNSCGSDAHTHVTPLCLWSPKSRGRGQRDRCQEQPRSLWSPWAVHALVHPAHPIFSAIFPGSCSIETSARLLRGLRSLQGSAELWGFSLEVEKPIGTARLAGGTHRTPGAPQMPGLFSHPHCSFLSLKNRRGK